MEKRILFHTSSPKDIFIIGVENQYQSIESSITIEEQSLKIVKNGETTFNFDIVNAITINTLEDFTKYQSDFKKLVPSKTKILYIPNFIGEVVLNDDNNNQSYLEIPFCYVYETTIDVNINDIDTSKFTEVKEKIKIPKTSEFKTKRKYISFISALKGTNIRLNRECAFIDGSKLSGMMDGVKFKLTICEDGSINLEEIDTNFTNKDQLQHFINDLDEKDVTGYTGKFVIANLPLHDIDGNLCYLEVEHQKPIDNLLNLLDIVDVEEITQNTVLNEKSINKLDFLFSDDDDEDENGVEETNEIQEEVISSKPLCFEEEMFKKLEEDKKKELNTRIENKTKEIQKTKNEINTITKKLNTYVEELKSLNSRLETMVENVEPNGYLFFVSEEIKSDIDINELEIKFIDKICDLLKVDKNALIDKVSGGYYKISISDENTISKLKPTQDLYDKIIQIDPLCNLSIEDNEYVYKGELDWHMIVDKMLKLGFTQNAEFNKLCDSNSYITSTYQSLGNGMGILMESYNSRSISKPEPKTEEEIKAKIEECKENEFNDKENYYWKKLRRMQNLEEIEKLEKELENPNLSDNEKLQIDNKIQYILDGKPEFKCEEMITFDEPTDLVLIGTMFDVFDPFKNCLYEEDIYDDYHTISIYRGGEFLTDMDLEGRIMVVTLKDYERWVKTDLAESKEFDDTFNAGSSIDAFLLPSFKGTLYKSFRLPSGEYVTSEDGIYYEQDTFLLNLPENTNILKIKNHDLTKLDNQ